MADQITSPQLPLDSDDTCMVCKSKPSEDSTLTCVTCATPWHVDCLSKPPENMALALKFECPDCTGDGLTGAAVPVNEEKKDLFARIREIEADAELTEKEKARKRQLLLSGEAEGEEEEEAEEDGEEKGTDVLGVLKEIFKCSYCMELPVKPVTTPCGHNFCLNCFAKWMKQGKQTCPKCRTNIPSTMAIQPRINSKIVTAIRLAKLSRTIVSGGPQNVYRFLRDQDRPDKAYTTERSQKPGMANAASGRIMVTLPSDHFGPIPAENDPERNQGVLVGESWDMRMDVRQWGVHYPPVAGIAGASKIGSQSVVISGGYEDDEDNGEWFIYTGSGGRDLSGNKRTSKEQAFDQEFSGANQALLLSCDKGYPVRVVRSEKDKRSSYAPEKGYRYDGIYRIEKCWRKNGIQGKKVCRYLFVRCDNEPAPWTSDEHGDRPRQLPVIPELRQATDVFERAEAPSWDYDSVADCWKWMKPPPPSKEKVVNIKPEEREVARKVIRKAQNISITERLLKEFSCLLCDNVMNLPLTTPCAHNYCKACLEKAFAGKSFETERQCRNGRKLRAQKNFLKCPHCPTDISAFLQNPQVNRDLVEVIERLQADLKAAHKKEEADADSDANRDEEAAVHHGSVLKRKGSSEGMQEEGNAKKPKTDGEETTAGESNHSAETNADSDEVQGAALNGNASSPSSPLQLHSVTRA